MKEGFTTGTCATAAAKGALMALVTGKQPGEIQVHLPVGRVIDIPVYRCSLEADRARCSVIKDAGDDPDATHGAEIGCEIQLTTGEEIIFRRGEGVGIVTLAGLEIGVGEPAINPVPRKMIRDALTKLRHDYDLEAGIIVTVFVTDGKRIAKKTLNERVGIVEGISILGTTGIVKPYSSASYIASIVQGVDVAIANKVDELVLNSGARSEKYLRVLFPEFPEQAFIHYGNWIGDTLEKIASASIKKVSIGIMLGKAVKLAEGRTDTHSCVAGWNKAWVQELARKSGYRPTEVARIAELNIAGRLTEIFDFNTTEPLYQTILAHCYKTCKKTLIQTELDMYLIGKNGEIITYISGQ